MEYPKKYLPKKLSKRDKNKQKKALEKAREGYKNKKYIDRPKVDIKNKESPHIVKAKKIYKINKIVPDKVSNFVHRKAILGKDATSVFFFCSVVRSPEVESSKG